MNVKTVGGVVCLMVLAGGIGVSYERPESNQSFRGVGVGDCSFSANPARFRDAMRLHIEELSSRTERVMRRIPAVSGAGGGAQAAMAADDEIASRNYIDDHIFGRMRDDGIPHARPATDSEFMRRVHLDLTGRIPTAAQVRSFLEDTSPSKRSALITSLIGSPEYVDKWTMFFGDLLRNTARETNVVRFAEGRNAFYNTIKGFVSSNTPYDVFVTKALTGAGNSYTVGEANFAVGGFTPMGPPQDTADTLLVRTATQFLGLANFDCVLCHDGAGHLESLNVWAAGMKRSDAWQMSAFFSRTRLTRSNTGNGNRYSWNVTDTTTGDYQLNTTSGNRTPRSALADGSTVVRPKYLFSSTGSAGASYRATLADSLVRDRQFARAAVNYLWRELMGQGIVEPADQFDLERLDPSDPPPDGWTLQPSHPELLEALADDFIAHGYDVRYILKLIADSSAYQLSARFDGEWSVAYEPYFARKLVRRLWAEELHDAIAGATGVSASYTPGAYTEPVQWAMQLPDTVEPLGRANTGVTSFLDAFLRGNRDQNLRSGDASIPQALQIMNNTFVTSRIRASDSRTLVARLLADRSLSDAALVDAMFLTTLSRFPTSDERSVALDGLRANRTTGAENLQWVLLNKIDFLYNY